jgi:CRP-like cAMP-binding protein
MNETVAKQQLIDYFCNRIALSESEKERIATAYSLIKLDKKKHLFEQGKRCVTEGFVVGGTLRVYYIDQKGLEHVLYFALKDWWVGDIASFFSGEPAALNAQALEDSWLLVIDPERKDALFEEVPAIERLFRIISQKHLTVLQKRFLLTVSANAAERFQELMLRSPGIEQLVPQHQIASFLGILPESLSRMKKQMNKNQL